MSDQPASIKPADVPLSHKGTSSPAATPADSKQGMQLWQAGVLFGGLLLFGLLAWTLLAPSTTAPSPKRTTNPLAASDAATNSPAPRAAKPDDRPPPFAAAQAELARKKAQEALALFVERQIELKERLDVESWGQDDFDAALALANAGDDQFTKEQFATAQESYEAAAQALGDLIERSGDKVEALLASGLEALDRRDEDTALAAFQQAKKIAPNDNRAQSGLDRVALLPQVTKLERTARNQGLAGEWRKALATYQQIEKLDPATTGLDAALAEAEQQVQQQALREALSEGFAALEANRFSAARQAFNEALRLEPGNDVAEGGLREIEASTTVRRLAKLERAAKRAVQEEAWATAIENYDAALKIDSNIAFARAGKPQALTQQRIAAVLQRIIDNPLKLSSDSLLEDGRKQLARGQQLDYQGPKLKAKLEQVSRLLELYATPVPVQLTSDNRTKVLLSSIGELGRFEAKKLTLRPGQYTLLGSRAGCRDIRETLIVRPDMAPVDIRCREEL